MSLFNETMTVYNCITDESGKTSWKRSVIRGIQWSHNKTETSTSSGIQTEKRVESITIDFQRSYGRSDMYVDPVTFSKLDDKTGYWTLNTADGKDVCVLGEATEEISSSYRIDQLRKDYQYCGTVTAVSDNRNRAFLKQIKAVVE